MCNHFHFCLSIFAATVLAQGCFGQLAIELRNKCEISNTNEANEAEAIDADGAVPAVNKGCHQCNENLCNNVSAEGSDCVQCDSNEVRSYIGKGNLKHFGLHLFIGCQMCK